MDSEISVNKKISNDDLKYKVYKLLVAILARSSTPCRTIQLTQNSQLTMLKLEEVNGARLPLTVDIPAHLDYPPTVLEVSPRTSSGICLSAR